MTDDVTARARAALEGVTPGPWDATEAFDASFVCAGEGRVSDTWIVRLDNRPGRVKDRADARFIAASRSLVPELLAEVERLHSWDGLMSLLDERWPESIFPTLPDNPGRDPGPRIVSLLRWVEQLKALQRDDRQNAIDAIEERDRVNAELERLRQSWEEAHGDDTECDRNDWIIRVEKLQAEVERLRGALDHIASHATQWVPVQLAEHLESVLRGEQ